MPEEAKNIEISQEMIDKLLSNSTFLDAVAKKLGASQPNKAKVGGFVDAGDISGGAFPQMTREQLYNFAKSVNAGINQEVALAQYEQLAK